MSGDTSNPPPNVFGSHLFETLRWKPPVKEITEEQRAREEHRLQGLAGLGAAIGADFDVEGEMARRGMKSSATIAKEKAAAEAAAAAEVQAKADAEKARADVAAAAAAVAEAKQAAAARARAEEQESDLAYRVASTVAARLKAEKKSKKGK